MINYSYVVSLLFSLFHYRRRKNGAPQCADCGAVLPGVARGTKNIVKKLPKSARRPERPFGGVLCSKCTRKTIIARIKA